MKKLVCLLMGSLVLGLLIGCTLGPKTSTKPASGGPKDNSPHTNTSTAAASSSQTGNATTVPEMAGWHLVETKYFVPDIDVDVNGGPVKSTQSGTGATLLDYYQDSGDIGNITLAVKRTGEGGQVFASMQWQIIWSAPPSTLPDGLPASFDVEHKVLEAVTWNPPVLKATFDQPDMKPGYSSSSPNTFWQPNGSKGQYKDTREEVYNMQVTMTTKNPIAKGKAGDRKAIYINFGEGYGMRYTYEWR